MKIKKNPFNRSIKIRLLFYSLLLIFILLLLVIISASIGAAKIPPGQTIKIMLSLIPFLQQKLDYSSINANFFIIIFNVRLPRIFLSLLVGMALAGTGVMYQGLFRNPLADPYIIGIPAGASFAASLAILLGFERGWGGITGIILFAFLGALLVSFIIFNLSREKSGHVFVLHLLLSGIAISALFNAGTSFVMMLAKEEMHRIVFWIMGSLSAAQWDQVKITAPIILLGLCSLSVFARDLNVISLGENRARQLGINTRGMKNLIILLSSIIIAAAVSVTGVIAFIGLIVPHMMRLIVGPDNRVLMPLSVLSGGILLLIADTLARNLMSPREIPVGIITALLGSPFFIYLLMEAKKKRLQ